MRTKNSTKCKHVKKNKITPTHLIIKFLKTNDKENILGDQNKKQFF